MAMKGRRIINFNESWSIAGSGGLEIWVLVISFWKSEIGWPQQPLTEKVLKFNMIFHDSSKIILFSKHQNKAEFKDLDHSEVLSSDFPVLRTSAECSLNDLNSLNNLNGLNDLDSLISSKILLILMVGSSLAPKWPILAPFCGMDNQNSIFCWYMIPFLSEAAYASWCYFFENRWKKLKCPNLLKPLGTLI